MAHTNFRKRSTWLSGALLVATGLSATSARADAEQAMTLDFEVAPGADGCPDAHAFGDAVAAHLGYDPFGGVGTRSIRARIRAVGSHVTGSIELLDDKGALLGSKSLESNRCEDLVSAMSFAVGMAIDPSRTLHASTRTAPVVAPVAPLPEQPPLPHEEDAAVPAEPLPVKPGPGLRFVPSLLAGGGVAGLGPVAGVGAVAYAGVGVRYGAASLELEGRYGAPSSEGIGGNKEVTTSTIGAALIPCAHWGPIFVCGQLFLGVLQGQAAGIEHAQGQTTVFSQVGARGGVAIPLPWAPLALEPFVDGLVTLTPTELQILGGTVWSTRPVEVVGGVRAVLHFL
jgi:hypothetical protein